MVVSLGVVAPAQDGDPSIRPGTLLTESESVRLALARPAVQTLAEGRVALARSDVTAASRWSNPEIEYAREKVNRQPTDTTEEFYWLTQRFELSGQRGLRRQAAEHRVRAATLGIETDRVEIEAEARARFYQVLHQQERLGAIAHWTRRMSAIEAVIRKRQAAGDVSGYDTLRLSTEQSSAQASLRRAQAGYKRLWAQLGSILGGADSIRVYDGVAGRLLPDPPPPLALLFEAVARRPDIARLAQEAQAHTLERRAGQRGWVPETLGVGRKTVDDDLGSESGPMIAAGITIPLFDHGQAEEQRASASAAIARPSRAGERTLELILTSPELSITHRLGAVTVYPDQHSAALAQPDEEGGVEAITFLKEQQWKVDFATAEVQQRRLRASIMATGTIKARTDGKALVGAPTAGHLLPSETFPRIGARVARGDPLATITPRVAGEVDVASLELAVRRARSELRLAVRSRKRLADLVSQQATPQRRLNEAESVEQVARAELEAATHRLDQYRRTLGTEDRAGATGVTVRAPIDGTLAEIRVAAGSFVDEGQPMFRIVETDRLWLEASVAEADLGRLRDPTGAWFEVEGFDRTFEIDAETGGRLVAFGKVVDPVRRTVPLIFEFANLEGRLRVGMFAQVRIWTGQVTRDTAIPVAAVIDEAGQDVVYVMLGGESFERRILRLGIRDSDYVQVRSGLEPGARIVTRGAYMVRLAAASPAEAGHDHAH
jgi:RND family efflux transporter MFP subunit